MTIIDLTFVHVGTGLLSASRQPWVNYTLAAYLAWRDMSSLVSWLAIVDLVVVMVVVPDWWDLSRGRGAAAPSHQEEMGRRPPPLFHQNVSPL